MYIRIYMHIYLPRQMRGGTRDAKRNKNEFLSYERLSIAHQLTHCPYSSYQLSISIISSNSTVKNAVSWCVLQENYNGVLFTTQSGLKCDQDSNPRCCRSLFTTPTAHPVENLCAIKRGDRNYSLIGIIRYTYIIHVTTYP